MERVAASRSRQSGTRRRRPFQLGCILGVVFGCVLGCVDDEPRQDPLVVARDWCDGLCTLYERCSEPVAAGCANGCVSRTRAYTSRIVPEALEAEADCFRERAGCSAGLDAVFAECFEQAGLAAPPSRASDRFCAQLSETFFECRWFDAPDTCSQVNARYAGPALAEGERCRGTPCEELVQCMEATVWTWGE